MKDAAQSTPLNGICENITGCQFEMQNRMRVLGDLKLKVVSLNPDKIKTMAYKSRISRVQASRGDDWEFESQKSQTNDLQN